MAGDWIKMREALHEDPAVLAMAQKLETRPEHVVGYCHRFWSWLSRNCHDGIVTGVTLESVESVLNLPGFLVMMCEVGWLEYETCGGRPIVKVPKFDRHLSQGAKNRGLAAERKAIARAESVPKMSRSNADKNGTREEKRREDIPPPPTPAPTATPPRDADPEWVGVVADLHGAGVSRCQTVAAKARANGCTPLEVRALLENWRTRDDLEAGALHDRILEHVPGGDCSSGWPPPVPKPPDKAAERARVANAAAEERARADRQNAADDAERIRLNAEHGAAVDALSLEAIAAIMDARTPGWRNVMRMPGKGRDPTGSLRMELLLHFDAQTARAP